MNKKIIISLFIFTLFCINKIPVSNAYIKCSGISGYAYDATNGEIGIENVKVELVKYKYDDTKEDFIEDCVADTIYTAEDGFYAFNKIGYEEGFYKIRFIYGDSTNGMNEIINTATYINENGYKRQDTIDQADLLNIMKYNGQDYWTKKVSIESEEEASWEVDNTTGKKHYVYFVADCSGSMSPFLNEVKICINKMAEKFHEQDEENKMGAIRVLEPENCKLCVPLTSNIDELSAENLSAQGLDVGYGIDENLIYGVFLAANDFYENYQKEYYDEGIDFNEADFDVSIVVLTDGWPCLPYLGQIYKNIDMTAKYYNELINSSDINLYPIAIGNYGGIFNNNVPYWQATDVNAIEDVFKSIYTSISTGETVKSQNAESCFYDDALRREEINNEFMNSNYEKINIFTDVSKANILSEKTKMIANGSEFYYIVNSGSQELGEREIEDDSTSEETDDSDDESKDPDEVKEMIENIKYLFENYDKLIEKLLEMIADGSGYTGTPTTPMPTVPATPGTPTTPIEKIEIVENQNLKLYEREPFDLEINKYLTGVKVILSDGTELINLYTVQMRNVNKTDPFNQSIQILPDKILAILDTTILHGTTVMLEYTVKITNRSTNICQNGKFALLNYLPSNLFYQNTIVTATNAEVPFKVITKEELYESDFLGNIIYERAAFDGLEQSNFIIWETPNLYLGVNESIEIKYQCSGYTAAEQDEFKCLNTVEVLEYSTERVDVINSNDWGRRMCRRDGATNKLIYCTPGNFYKLNEVGNLVFKNEIDSATAITFSIIPPTGGIYIDDFKLKLMKLFEQLIKLLFKI